MVRECDIYMDIPEELIEEVENILEDMFCKIDVDFSEGGNTFRNLIAVGSVDLVYYHADPENEEEDSYVVNESGDIFRLKAYRELFPERTILMEHHEDTAMDYY